MQKKPQQLSIKASQKNFNLEYNLTGIYKKIKQQEEVNKKISRQSRDQTQQRIDIIKNVNHDEKPLEYYEREAMHQYGLPPADTSKPIKPKFDPATEKLVQGRCHERNYYQGQARTNRVINQVCTEAKAIGNALDGVSLYYQLPKDLNRIIDDRADRLAQCSKVNENVEEPGKDDFQPPIEKIDYKLQQKLKQGALQSIYDSMPIKANHFDKDVLTVLENNPQSTNSVFGTFDKLKADKRKIEQMSVQLLQNYPLLDKKERPIDKQDKQSQDNKIQMLNTLQLIIPKLDLYNLSQLKEGKICLDSLKAKLLTDKGSKLTSEQELIEDFGVNEKHVKMTDNDRNRKINEMKLKYGESDFSKITGKMIYEPKSTQFYDKKCMRSLYFHYKKPEVQKRRKSLQNAKDQGISSMENFNKTGKGQHATKIVASPQENKNNRPVTAGVASPRKHQRRNKKEMEAQRLLERMEMGLGAIKDNNDKDQPIELVFLQRLVDDNNKQLDQAKNQVDNNSSSKFIQAGFQKQSTQVILSDHLDDELAWNAKVMQMRTAPQKNWKKGDEVRQARQDYYFLNKPKPHLSEIIESQKPPLYWLAKTQNTEIQFKSPKHDLSHTKSQLDFSKSAFSSHFQANLQQSGHRQNHNSSSPFDSDNKIVSNQLKGTKITQRPQIGQSNFQINKSSFSKLNYSNLNSPRNNLNVNSARTSDQQQSCIFLKNNRLNSARMNSAMAFETDLGDSQIHIGSTQVSDRFKSYIKMSGIPINNTNSALNYSSALVSNSGISSSRLTKDQKTSTTKIKPLVNLDQVDNPTELDIMPISSRLCSERPRNIESPFHANSQNDNLNITPFCQNQKDSPQSIQSLEDDRLHPGGNYLHASPKASARLQSSELKRRLDWPKTGLSSHELNSEAEALAINECDIKEIASASSTYKPRSAKKTHRFLNKLTTRRAGEPAMIVETASQKEERVNGKIQEQQRPVQQRQLVSDEYFKSKIRQTPVDVYFLTSQPLLSRKNVGKRTSQQILNSTCKIHRIQKQELTPKAEEQTQDRAQSSFSNLVND